MKDHKGAYPSLECVDIEQWLGLYLEGKLTGGIRQSLEEHLNQCSDCQTVVSIFRQTGERNCADLTDIIIESTSGPLCPRIKSSLPDWMDGVLKREDFQLIEHHLDSCLSCRQMAQAMREVQAGLAQLVPVSLPENLTQQILDATSLSKHNPYVFSLKSGVKLRSFWEKFTLRPRFSLEAAYIGALLMFTLVSLLPTERIGQDSAEKLSGFGLEIIERIENLSAKTWNEGSSVLHQYSKTTRLKADEITEDFVEDVEKSREFWLETVSLLKNEGENFFHSIDTFGEKLPRIFGSETENEPDS
jgi:hypothetical protein